MNQYSIKISKGNGLRAWFTANSHTLSIRLDSFEEKGFLVERVKKTNKGAKAI